MKLPNVVPQQVSSQPSSSGYSDEVQFPVKHPPAPVVPTPLQEPPSPIIKQTVNPFDFAGYTAVPSPPAGLVGENWTNTLIPEVREGSGGETRRWERVGEGRGREGGEGGEK